LNPIFSGLTSALTWGAGDFAGGLASRRAGAYRASLYGEALGLLMLLPAAAVVHEPAMQGMDWVWSGLAGVMGSIGLVILYRALAEGQMSTAAPVSALMAAVLPVLVAALTEGLPAWTTFAGFALALAAIWLVSQSEGASKETLVRFTDLRMPLLSGVCFGVYFILMHQGSRQAVLWPLVAARAAGSLALLVFVAARREVSWPEKSVWPLVFLNAVGDIGGNLFFVLAGQAGRLDVASVLASLYPGTTVVLAWLVLKERLNLLQKIGILAALAAIVLIAL
jgi:drug/metabolite transporter (DMT)-like permease